MSDLLWFFGLVALPIILIGVGTIYADTVSFYLGGHNKVLSGLDVDVHPCSWFHPWAANVTVGDRVFRAVGYSRHGAMRNAAVVVARVHR